MDGGKGDVKKEVSSGLESTDKEENVTDEAAYQLLDPQEEQDEAMKRFSNNMAAQAEKYVKIQHNTFTNWCNDSLKSCNITVKDLSTDLENGIILIKLVETLSGRKVGRYHQKTKNKPQKLENVAKALKLIAKDTVQLVNIGNEDIVNGNLKLILGLIWRLILTYQIKVKADSDKTKASAKKLMMTWIHSVVPDCSVRNLNKDWNNGIVLCALIDNVKPGSCPQWPELNPNEPLDNAKLGMQIAEKELGIPQVLSPEDLISPELDDLSMLTYLSYFTSNSESPGYKEILEFVNSHLPTNKKVRNFSSDWKDGKALIAFVNSLYPGATKVPSSTDTPEELIHLALLAAEHKFGIKPLITPKNLVSADAADEFTLLTYLSMFRNCRSMYDMLKNCSVHGPGLTKGSKNNFAEFIINLTNELDGKNLKVEVSHGRVKANVNLNDNRKGKVFASFFPIAAGEWTIDITYRGCHLPGSPFKSLIHGDSRTVSAKGDGLSKGCIGKATDFAVHSVTGGELVVNIEDSVGKKVDYRATQEGNDNHIQYIPLKAGNHTITIEWDRSAVEGSPFTANICDLSKVSVEGDGLRKGYLGQPSMFTVRIPKDAGTGKLCVNVSCIQDDMLIPVQIEDNDPTNCIVTFTPTKTFDYRIDISFAGFPLSDVSYICKVDKPIDHTKCFFDPVLPERILANRVLEFGINTVKSGRAKLTVSVVRLDDNSALSAEAVSPNDDGKYVMKLDSVTAGKYKVSGLWNGSHITGSPFNFTALDFHTVRVSSNTEPDTLSLVNRAIDVLLSCGHEFLPEDVTVQVKSSKGSIPLKVKREKHGSGRLIASFTPTKGDKYAITVNVLNEQVTGSPLTFKVIDPNKVIIDDIHGKIVNSRTLIPIHMQNAGPGVLDIHLYDPKRNTCDYRLDGVGSIYKVTFIPSQKGTYYLDVNFSGYKVAELQPFEVDNPVDASKCITIGGAINSIFANQKNEIIVDSSKAGPGELIASIHGVHEQPLLQIDQNDGIYKLYYVINEPGAYLLNIKWSNDHIPGSPFKIDVKQADTDRVKAHGNGLREGLVGIPAQFTVDTVDAGPGNLSVRVAGPKADADVKVVDQTDGTYLVQYCPNEIGSHKIHISYNDQVVNRDLITARITRPPNASKVTVEGPGLRNSRLENFNGEFSIDTRNAGAGTLKVRIYGPKGAFKVHMSRDSKIDRVIDVKYNPTEIGHYKVDIKWSDVHVPGSPFDVWIVRSEEDLEKVRRYERTDGWNKYVHLRN